MLKVVSIAQAVVEKTNLEVNKGEKVRGGKKVRATANDSQHGQGWLGTPMTSN